LQKSSRRYSLQPSQRGLDDLGLLEGGSSAEGTPPRSKRSVASKGVFGKEKNVGFSRMSFNTRLNAPGKKADTGLINVPSAIVEEGEGGEFPPGYAPYGRKKSRSGLDEGSRERRRSSVGSTSSSVSPRRSINVPSAGVLLGSKQLADLGRMAAAAIARQRRESDVRPDEKPEAPPSASLATTMYPPVVKRAGAHSAAGPLVQNKVSRGDHSHTHPFGMGGIAVR